MKKILIIQTAFIGDVVLATSLIESLHATEEFQIDFLVRKGNEGLLKNHPFLNEVIVWNKKENKYKNWISILFQIRKKKYDAVVNVQRYAATGLWTALSGAKLTIGFHNNPFSFMFSRKVIHQMKDHTHEIERNHQLLATMGEIALCRPKLYPSEKDRAAVLSYTATPFITMAPSSVWFTKQFPKDKWIEFIQQIPFGGKVYLLGGNDDRSLLEDIRIKSNNVQCVNLSGQLNLLESTALQSAALLNYVNDSAPMHFASSVNAPVVAIYCSTIPAFGYGPLSDNSTIVEIAEPLSCRPCGLHGKRVCPEKHFQCGMGITMAQLNQPLLRLLKQL